VVRSALGGFRHEIIVADDDSPDGTYAVAQRCADVAVKKVHEGQTKGVALRDAVGKVSCCCHD